MFVDDKVTTSNCNLLAKPTPKTYNFYLQELKVDLDTPIFSTLENS